MSDYVISDLRGIGLRNAPEQRVLFFMKQRSDLKVSK
jgi:hypothetical protein